MANSEILINSECQRPPDTGQETLQPEEDEDEALQSRGLNLDKPLCIDVRVLMVKKWDPDTWSMDIWVDEHFEPQTPLNPLGFFCGEQK